MKVDASRVVDLATRTMANWLANRMERQVSHDRCKTYDLDDFPEERWDPRTGLDGRCAICWIWDIIDNLRDYAR